MDREEILEIIRSNLETAGLQDADIRIQPDLLSGWRIAVISDEFKDMSMADRRGTALKGLEKIDIEWDEFLFLTESWNGKKTSIKDLHTNAASFGRVLWKNACLLFPRRLWTLFPRNSERSWPRRSIILKKPDR